MHTGGKAAANRREVATDAFTAVGQSLLESFTRHVRDPLRRTVVAPTAGGVPGPRDRPGGRRCGRPLPWREKRPLPVAPRQRGRHRSHRASGRSWQIRTDTPRRRRAPASAVLPRESEHPKPRPSCDRAYPGLRRHQRPDALRRRHQRPRGGVSGGTSPAPRLRRFAGRGARSPVPGSSASSGVCCCRSRSVHCVRRTRAAFRRDQANYQFMRSVRVTCCASALGTPNSSASARQPANVASTSSSTATSRRRGRPA